MFTEKDKKQIKERGSSIKDIEQQLDSFKNGFPFIRLVAPATKNNGIVFISKRRAEKLSKIYDEKAPEKDIIKFIPASGAATRMFQHLFEFRQKYDRTVPAFKKLFAPKGFNSVHRFFKKLKKFAFYNSLAGVMQNDGIKISNCLRGRDYNTVIDYLVEDKGLGYGDIPKAFILFHKYLVGARMAIEEHMVESANYSIGKGGVVKILFTATQDKLRMFEKEVNRILPAYEKDLGVKFDISLSVQKPSTDLIAVNLNNEPVRDENGVLLFRPGGHGALLVNLNEINNEIIFIKNIDNIVPDWLRETTNLYKKALGGYLLQIQEETYRHLRVLDKKELTEDELIEAVDFAINELFIDIIKNFSNMSFSKRRDFIHEKLNRPIRVCGMVKNEGEPGGGPFWVKTSRGDVNLQIVERSQIDNDDADQRYVFDQSTHFNPVDLVCCVRDYKGNKFDLNNFVDPTTGFITVKSRNGKEIKAQELPGLWNGAMTEWTTVFVQVPVITFNPVKIINDLLRKQHQ